MRILIVEDQPTAALLLRRFLERMGHEVSVARDGMEAWNALQADRALLVITDWMMPRMDGLELCRRIRSSGTAGYTYVILLTARDCHLDRLVGLRAGADDFLTKPPDPEELEVRLEIAGRILAVHETLRIQNAQLAELATTDELTGVKNRRRFREDLEMHAALAAREQLPLSLIMLDVDNFKRYNDTHGHPAGDEALRVVARALRDDVRIHDVVARYGGEEFAILLPATDARVATEVCERLRAAIARHTELNGGVTASFGVSTADEGTSALQTLIEQADQALYLAKRSGRNCVCHFRQTLPGPSSCSTSQCRARPLEQGPPDVRLATRERSA